MKRVKLLNKRKRNGLSIYGWLLVVALMVALGIIGVRNAVSFLSAENTLAAKVMVVEGYIPDYAYREILDRFHKENYSLIVATGTTYDQGFYITNIKSSAELIGNSLLYLGFDSTKLAVVAVSEDVQVDRTYHSALVTRNYLRAHHPEIVKINVVSLGPHARRSLYLFEMAYEPEIEVGNIVIPQIGVDEKDWYKTSRGFRTVLDEGIAWLYVKLAFWPDTNP